MYLLTLLVQLKKMFLVFGLIAVLANQKILLVRNAIPLLAARGPVSPTGQEVDWPEFPPPFLPYSVFLPNLALKEARCTNLASGSLVKCLCHI